MRTTHEKVINIQDIKQIRPTGLTTMLVMLADGTMLTARHLIFDTEAGTATCYGLFEV